MASDRPTTAQAKRNANTFLQNYKEQKLCDLIVTAVGVQNVTGNMTNTQKFPDHSDVESHYDIHCHKTVLSANSSYFDTILATEIPRNGNGVLKTRLTGNAYGMAMTDARGQKVKIVLRDVDKNYLKPIIDYMYSGKIELTFDNLKHVYRNAEKLKVEKLISDCKSYVEQEEVTASNCIKLMMCAKEMGREDIETESLNYFLDNIPAVRQLSSGEIRKLPLAVMKKMMNSDKLNTRNTEAAFKLLIMWADSDRSNRPQHLHSLMEQQIELLPSEFLLNFLTNEEVVSSTHSTLKLVTSALRVKQSASHPTSPSSPTWPVSSVSPNSATGQSNQSDQDTLLVLTSVFKDEGNGVHEKFDPDNNTWSEWTTKDMGDGYGAVVVGEWMAIIGGMTPAEHKGKVTITGGMTHVEHKCNVQMYNLRTKEWSGGPQMEHPRAFFGCCVMNGDTIVVCGGTTTYDEDFAECEMLKLDPNGTGTWEEIPPMTIKRQGCSAASINNKIFVVGGYFEMDDGTETVLSTVEEFDVTTKTWSTRKSMNEARVNFAMATHQKKIYVFGGWRDGNNLYSCERDLT